jgi:hypothetical protein
LEEQKEERNRSRIKELLEKKEAKGTTTILKTIIKF